MGHFSDFDEMVQLFMDDYGFQAQLVHVISSTPNDTTGAIDIITQTRNVRAIRMELLRPMNGVGSTLNTQILTGDQILYIQPTEKIDSWMQPLVIDPTSDTVVINSVSHKIVTCKLHSPDAYDNVLYELYIRK